jgi:hypothetical protein
MPARVVPDGRDDGGADRKLREQIDARGDVLERRRPPASGAHPPVLQVPHGVAAPH